MGCVSACPVGLAIGWSNAEGKRTKGTFPGAVGAAGVVDAGSTPTASAETGDGLSSLSRLGSGTGVGLIRSDPSP